MSLIQLSLLGINLIGTYKLRHELSFNLDYTQQTEPQVSSANLGLSS